MEIFEHVTNTQHGRMSLDAFISASYILFVHHL